MAQDGLRQQLTKAGLRVTPQRMAILHLLCQSKEHPTAARLFADVQRQHPNIALGTVYYTLERLVEAGIVTSIGAVGDDQTHYDGDTSSHTHLACLSCQKIMDVESPDFQTVTEEIESNTGYSVVGTCFVYYGLCPDCQKLKLKNKK